MVYGKSKVKQHKQQSILKYLRKRSGSPLDDISPSAKRIKMDKNNVKTKKARTSGGKRYHKGGLANSLHGVVYQLKLQMLFLKRALKMKYKFDLGTEVEAAEKFDDIVLKYEKKVENIVFKYQSEKGNIRFVQAKHKQDESKKITVHDLLAKNMSGHDFSLQKYFISFRKIKENPMFNNYELEDLIIYTNIDFNYSDLENAGIQLEEFEENDEILRVDNSKKTAKRYRFKVQEGDNLYQALIETSDLYILADELMHHLVNNVPINMKDDIWKHYHVPLGKSVFVDPSENETKQNLKNNVCLKFRDDFVENKSLSEKVINFRETLKSVFNIKDETSFKKKLSELKLSVPSNFGKEFQLPDPLIDYPEKLAKEIVEYLNTANENNIVSVARKANVIKNNIDKLAGHVLVLDDDGVLIRFRKAFFEDNHELDGHLSTFKNALKTELGRKGIDFSNLLHYRFKISNYKTCKETSDEVELPTDIIKNEFEEFFGKLVFAVNQPCEVELGNIIAKELGESSQFNLLNSDLINDSLQRQILDWFKEKGNIKGQEGRFLDHKDGLDFFNSIEKKVNSLMCVALSLPVLGELRKIGIEFDKNDIFDYLKTFLYEKNYSPKVLHLKTDRKLILLNELKVYSALENIKKQEARYKKRDSYIFIKLEALLQLDTQKIALEAFRASGSHHLLIITCDCANEEIEIKQLHSKLSKILSESEKPVILIAEENNTLVKKFPADQIDDFESTTKFDDLTDGSKLLEKKVIFQRDKGDLKLNQLFSREVSNDIIDSETLVQLISNKTIRVGKRLLGKSDLDGAYNKTYEMIDKDVLVDILRELANSKDFFVISGLDGTYQETFINSLQPYYKNQISKLLLENDELQVIDLKKIMIADSKFKNNNFKDLCDSFPNKHLHWIKWQDDKYILYCIYNPSFMKRQFKFPDKITFFDDIKIELKSSGDNVFFFTGLETLEELFTVLQIEDEQEKKTLNENLESGKIVVQTSSIRNESEFNNLSKEKAKENKSVYWLDIINIKDGEKQIVWRDVTRKTVIEDHLIDALEGQSSIIIDKPGMGKSTTLAILSEKMLKTHWVVFIMFRDWQEVINNLPDEISNDAIIDFLTVTKNLETPLEKSLAKFLLDKSHEGGVKPLLLVFDGFDEIRSYEIENVGKKKVENLLRFLKENTRSTVWITAREHDAIQLQNILSMFCVKFEPLKKDQHYVYFKDFWMDPLKLILKKDNFDSIFSDDNKFDLYYNALSKAADAIFADEDNDFMGIPLTLRLFAEGFRNKFKHFVCSDECNDNFAEDFDNLSILNLYEYFVDQKFMIFIWEKTNLSTGFTIASEVWFREKLIKLHCRLAFKELFGEVETKELLGLKKPFEGEAGHVDGPQLTELANIGIIRSIKADHYEFLHRTIAEYFTSRLLIYILKTKHHNNLEKYKRTIQFLRSNILKQSNEIIKKFLEAGLQHDEKLYNILHPIIIDIGSKNLLGQTKRKYKFIIDALRYKKPGDLNEIKQEIENLRRSQDKPKVKEKAKKFESIIEKKFKPTFLQETDVEKLKNSLKYLMDVYDKAYDRPPQLSDNSISVSLRDNIPDFLNHYIFQAEEQNELDKEFLEDCFKKICTKPIRENSKFPTWNLERKSETMANFRKFIADIKISKNNVIDLIFASGILTIEMAEDIVSRFRNRSNGKVFFYSLISPFLSFKYYCSKYSFDFVKNIDNVALLYMFQSFASFDIRKPPPMDLSQISLEGILLCIRESLSPVRFFKDSFTVSLKALIALEYWNFQLYYKNNALQLCHGHDYTSEFQLKYEENIVKLLIFRNNNPEPDFDLKLEDTINTLSVVTPASI